MNILTEIQRGIRGYNVGLDLGLPKLNQDLGGIQKGESYALGGERKAGKTAYADQVFVLSPFLLNPNANVEWIYFSFEIDRIRKQAKYISYFLWKDYNIDVSDKYILGRAKNADGSAIIVTPEHYSKIKLVYDKYIVPLFGIYNDNGQQVTKGKIDFIEERNNPTGIRNYLMNYAEENGKFIREPYFTKEKGQKVKRERIIGYKENDSSLYTIIVIDHVRALRMERGFQMKQNIDKVSEYHVWLRNMCKFTFVIISHLNRSSNDLERLKFMGDGFYPTADMFKDSGNLAEDCTHVLTVFNPGDDKYNLRTHFKEPIPENYRSLHLVDSRTCPTPMHYRTLFDGKNIRVKEL